MDNIKNNRGFTLVELLVVIAVIAIMAAISIPNIVALRKGAAFREAVGAISADLRDARSRAVNHNLEYRLNFDVDANRYRLEEGNSNSGSTVWTPVFSGWRSFQKEVVLAAPSTCNDFTTDRIIEFNPNGSANALYVCVMDGTTVKYKVGVSSSTTGRVVIE